MMIRARRNGGGIAYYVAVVLVGILLAWVIAQVFTLSERADRSREDRDVLIEDVRVLRDQVEDMGQIPAAPEPEDRIDEDPPSPVSDERIDAAVQRFCGLPGCRGPRGFTGADSTVPGPRGPAGEDSTVPGPPGADSTVPGPAGADSTVPGPPGADSTVPGPQGDRGPGPTDAQVADAVAAFCGDDNCRGTAGDDGQDGRGIVAVTIEGNARECELVVAYTDDTQDRLEISPLICLR